MQQIITLDISSVVVGIAIINPVANTIKLFFVSPSLTLRNNKLERLPQQSVSEWGTS